MGSRIHLQLSGSELSMIEIEKINIINGDYSVLRRESVSEESSVLDRCLHEYIEDDIIDYLRKYVGTNCDTVYVEYPYYDSDYMSNYYEFYSKKLRLFEKKCCRLLLYRKDEKPKDPKDKDREPEGLLIGYISLRPTFRYRRIGRMFLDPQYCILERLEEPISRTEIIVHPGTAYIIAPKQKVHFYGTESFVEAAPHMTQEGDITVCAHVALWSILRSFSNRFTMYPEVRIGNLVQMIQPESERLIPSHGLTVHQISRVLLDFGFTPIVRYESNKVKASYAAGTGCDTSIMDEILTYVDSGIPVIGVSSNLQHAFAVVGRGDLCSENLKRGNSNAMTKRLDAWWESAKLEWDGKPKSSTFYLASRLVEELVVNDDNLFPYQFLETRQAFSVPVLTSLLNKANHIDGGKTLCSGDKIDGVIVPLYPRIQLDYDAVLNRFKALAENGFYADREPLVVRIFLTSANSFREYVKENMSSIDEGAYINDVNLKDCKDRIPVSLRDRSLSDILLKLELPKFIWVVETASPEEYEDGTIRSIVIFDSTSATVDDSPVLFPFFEESIESGRISMRLVRIDFKKVPETLQTPRFDNNLVKFSPE